MSSAAAFALLTNEGKQDRIICATALLNKRLAIIEDQRASDPYVLDPTPTLVDIQRTHILFVNSEFKPFAAHAFEYDKVNSPSTGTLTGVGQLQFNIKQFGDFIGDMAVYVRITVPNDFVTYTDDDPTLTDRHNVPALRWASYVGERLFKNVKFDVNGNPLDEYTREAYNFYREFVLTPNKLPAWKRLMGQEAPLSGFLRQPGCDLTGSSDSATGIANLGLAPQDHRVAMNVHVGNQTPKSTLSDLELIIPLIMWFNMDPRQSIPSVAIPQGARYITIDLASQNEIVGLVPRGSGTWASPRATLGSLQLSAARLYTNNIFVNSEIHDIYIRRIGFNLARVHRNQSVTTTKSSDELLLNKFKWPVEAIFIGLKESAAVNIPAAATYAPRYLDRWHSFSKAVNTAYDLSSVFGSEGMATNATTVASFASPTVTTAAAHGLSPGDLVLISGHLHTVQATNLASTTFDIYPLTPAPAASNTIQLIQKPKVEATLLTSTIDRLTVTAHGVPLYNDFELLFYSSYLPFARSTNTVNCPSDPGAVAIYFGFFPGMFQPSGHINLSRAREFYVSWTSSVITSDNPGIFYAQAIAINFLLVSDGSAVMRYTT